jgi:SAM-dependent methyltransferase
MKRNDVDFDYRQSFWSDFVVSHTPRSVLEVGCSVGGNLKWLASPDRMVCGVDVSQEAIRVAISRYSGLLGARAKARELPFGPSQFDLVFTSGVLIHQPTETLLTVMSEVVRCSARLVLCIEYYAEHEVEVPYHNVSGALFKRDFGAIYSTHFPLRTLSSGFLGRDLTGWDDVTWWLFEKVRPEKRKRVRSVGSLHWRNSDQASECPPIR